MAPVLKFFHMQPSEFWALSVREFNALTDYMVEYSIEMERANRG